MPYTDELIEAIHKLPLRKDVRWIDMSRIIPGKIIEEKKRTDGEAQGKWVGVDLECPECAAAVVAVHNEWLEAKDG